MKAVQNIEVLGNGCKIVDNTYVSTVPFELSNDQVFLMKLAEQFGFVDEKICRQSGWAEGRFNLAIVINQNEV